MPIRSMLAEASSSDTTPNEESKRRRKKKARRGEGHAWDSDDGKPLRSKREDKRQMFWMLVGGATLFALIVAWVVMALLGGDDRAKTSPGGALVQTDAVSHQDVPAKSSEAGLSDAEFLAKAEPLSRTFLEATRIEEMLPLVRNPGVAETRMKRYYQAGKIEAPGMADFNTRREINRKGTIGGIVIRTRDLSEKNLAFVDTPEGLKIDWESWVGWSEMPWAEFLESKSTEAKSFRLTLSSVDYYNFMFSDDKKWQSYRLVSPDGEHAIYGYAERDSILNSRIRPVSGSEVMAMTLTLKFPEGAISKNQVIIEKMVAEGWVTETEESP